MTSSPAFLVNSYLERIGCGKAVSPSVEYLAELQEQHLCTVPYENLDILAGREVSLQIPELFAKIVTQRRGGYCFELNALFGWLLRQLGYEVVDYVARFWRDEAVLPPLRRHHVLGVRAEDQWHLVDVGVGGVIPLRPLRLLEGTNMNQGEESYRLARDSRFGWVLEEQHHQNWRRVYSFTEENQEAEDFVFANFWCQKAAESVFRKGLILAIRNHVGRNSIAGREVRLFRPQGVEVLTPANASEWQNVLSEYFGIQLPESFPWAAVFPGVKFLSDEDPG